MTLALIKAEVLLWIDYKLLESVIGRKRQVKLDLMQVCVLERVVTCIYE